MKHFIVEITFKVAFEKIEPIVPSHRAHLQIGYDQNLLLCSGPQNPRVGGILVAKAESLEALQAFCGKDPYVVNGVADYRYIEFNPVKRQPAFEPWFS